MANEKGINNQIRVEITDLGERDKAHPYAIVSIDAAMMALRTLGAGGYALWSLLAFNQEGYVFDLGFTLVHSATGMGRAQYYAARSALIDAGYLVDTGYISPDRKHIYSFTAYPEGALQKIDRGSAENHHSENHRGENRHDENLQTYTTECNCSAEAYKTAPPNEDGSAVVCKADETPMAVEYTDSYTMYSDGTKAYSDGTCYQGRVDDITWIHNKIAGIYKYITPGT